MKLTLVFKTPDVYEDALEEALDSELLDDDERESKKEEALKVLNRFIDYGDQVCIEFDIEAETANVLFG